MIKLQTAPSSTLPLWALDARYLWPASCAERSWKLTLRRRSCFDMCQLVSPISDKSQHASSFLSFISPPLRLLLSPMPQCPRCSRKCKTNTCLLQHMNHPVSKCIQFLDGVTIQETQSTPTVEVQPYSHWRWRRCTDGTLWSASGLRGGWSFHCQWHSAWGPQTMHQLEKYHTKVYPGTARTYGKGSMFMDKFNDD